MSRIPDDYLKQLRDIDILEVAEQYFDLKQMGSIHQTKCIHKGDNDPSLTFFPQTNTFYCFGCRAGKKPVTEGSSVIDFVMWVDNCSFVDAVQKLSTMKGWQVPKTGLSAEDIQKHQAVQAALENNRTYWNALQGNEEYIQYLAERGIDQDDINKWRIGYSPKEARERFASRLVFALMNDWGQTVGFSYRNMSDQIKGVEDEGPKYINSHKSLIFDKGSILYGLNFVKRKIRERGYVIVGEGFGDTILGQKLDLPFVSIMGTSLTDQHIEILKRYTDTVILWMDGDKGGRRAAVAHAKELQQHGFLVKVIDYPGKDPDDIFFDILKDYDIEHARGLARTLVDAEAIMASQFEMSQILDRFDSDVMEVRLKTIRDLRPIVDSIPDKAEMEAYLYQVAKRLQITPDFFLRGE